MSKVVFAKDLTPIMKIDEGERLVKGIVYRPNEVDAHGDWMKPEEIKKSAYNFMKQLRQQNIDTKHSLQKEGAFVCESYIAKAADADGYPEGSWVIAVKIEDDTLWDDILAGDYEAFSMYGQGWSIPDSEPPTEEG